ncbi:MAG TPA: hypothetical protein VJN43_00995 [Bryobacteraceae bacterium]|nr:hypothetical protein [Bryobacteraceae bacterium]
MRSIEILPSDEKDAVQIFLGVKPRYEEYHGVVYDEAAIETAVAASVQFMPRRHLPEKALDLLDEAGSRIRLREPDEARECREHLRSIAQQLKAAIAGSESERIRALVEEERQTREKLILLQQKYKLNDPSPRKVTREEIEELIAERAGLPLEAVRARLGKK